MASYDCGAVYIIGHMMARFSHDGSRTSGEDRGERLGSNVALHGMLCVSVGVRGPRRHLGGCGVGGDVEDDLGCDRLLGGTQRQLAWSIHLVVHVAELPCLLHGLGMVGCKHCGGLQGLGEQRVPELHLHGSICFIIMLVTLAL